MTNEEYADGVIRQHVAECFRLQPALDSNDNDAVHEFRLACKRLRYAIERFEVSALAAQAKVLSGITDELGFAHDCVLLAKIARKAGASAVTWRASQDGSRSVKRGRALWETLAKTIAAAACCLLLPAPPARAAAPPSLPSALSAIVEQHPHALFGLAVYDLDARRLIYGYNAQRFFLAASTTKLLTEGTTLATLGPDYRFTTNVYRTGAIDAGGTLDGRIILRASGDPNLSGRIRPDGTLAFENEDHSYDGTPDTKAVPGNPLAVIDDLAAQIAGHGIKKITGPVFVDDSFFQAGYPESGTGLGGFAFIQPQYMVHYLAYLRTQPYFSVLYNSLPVLGVDGTLFNIANTSPARGKVHAKTGTWGGGDALNRRAMVSAKGLAGYMTTRSGRHIAFCFYVNNLAVAHGLDASRVAGQINGALATATYLYAR
jgi:D-alanyl-D-alanine carboxypeptidase